VDVTGESSDALVNVFALLTGLGIPAGPRPCPSVPELPGDACSLAQAFLGRGYLTFAVVARARHGTLLQGFPQRANGLLEDPVAVGLRWLESHRTRPSFLWIELPVRESLGTFLRGLDTQHLDPALVVLAPERDGPLIFRLPGRAGRDPQCRAPVQTRDVGATLFQLLGQAPPSGLGGRPFSLEDLQRGSIPPAPACTFQWSDAGLPPLHTLCLTLPAAGSAMSLGGGR